MTERTGSQLAAETMTVDELLRKIAEARSKMSDKNPNKLLFSQCDVAIRYLAGLAPDELLVAEEEKPLVVIP